MKICERKKKSQKRGEKRGERKKSPARQQRQALLLLQDPQHVLGHDLRPGARAALELSIFCACEKKEEATLKCEFPPFFYVFFVCFFRVASTSRPSDLDLSPKKEKQKKK